MIILTTGSDMNHAAPRDTLDGDPAGSALCGAYGYGEAPYGEPLRLTGPDDVNLTCGRCRRSRRWGQSR